MAKLIDNLFCHLSSTCRMILNKNKQERGYRNDRGPSLGDATSMIIGRTLLYAYASHLRIGIKSCRDPHNWWERKYRDSVRLVLLMHWYGCSRNVSLVVAKPSCSSETSDLALTCCHAKRAVALSKNMSAPNDTGRSVNILRLDQ